MATSAAPTDPVRAGAPDIGATAPASTRLREKAQRIGLLLDRLYPAPPIPLQHGCAFTLLVAVVLSAQTTDRKVNQVTPALFAAAATPEAMARLPLEQIPPPCSATNTERDGPRDGEATEVSCAPG